ncbi:MAG: TM2 domain-containing protein [Clostridia bacterium]|nr:TM2 domain-containing protein [Clostridia bacterium]
MIICPSCGAKNIDGREFCRVCGDYFPQNINDKTLSTKNDKPDPYTLINDVNCKIDKFVVSVENRLDSVSNRFDKQLLENNHEVNKTIEENYNKLKTDIFSSIDLELKKLQLELKESLSSDLQTIEKDFDDKLQNIKENTDLKINTLKQELQNEISVSVESKKPGRNFFGDISQYENDPHVSPLSKWIAFLLCFICGLLGLHRFYIGKPISGFVYLFTLGALGIGVIVDLILILSNKLKDKDDLLLKI